MSALPAKAALSVVQVWVDRPRMHGFHRFLLIDVPRRRKLQLLHLVHLETVELARSEIDDDMRAWIDGSSANALVDFLRHRHKALRNRRHAGALTEAVIARLEAQVARKPAPPRAVQIDMADFGEGRQAA